MREQVTRHKIFIYLEQKLFYLFTWSKSYWQIYNVECDTKICNSRICVWLGTLSLK